jgi:hypothetical protein
MYIYVYIYKYIHMYIYMYIKYLYINACLLAFHESHIKTTTIYLDTIWEIISTAVVRYHHVADRK